MYAAIRRVNAAWIDQGFDIVPAFATGRDHWPRIEHQVPWTDNPPMRYASPATERELVECAKDFKAFMDANRAKCPLDHVLTYAWNEFEEGAYICPLWAPNGGADVSRLKAFAKVARIFKGEQGVTAVPDGPLPDLADLRKRLPEIFKDCKDSFRHEWFATRLEAAERLAALPNRTPLMQAELDEFRASFRDALAHWANDPLNPAVKPEEIDARDFGVKGDGVSDDAPAFARAVDAVRRLGGRPCVLRIPAGLYTDQELREAGIIVDASKNIPTIRRGAEGDLVDELQAILNAKYGAELDVVDLGIDAWWKTTIRPTARRSSATIPARSSRTIRATARQNERKSAAYSRRTARRCTTAAPRCSSTGAPTISAADATASTLTQIVPA